MPNIFPELLTMKLYNANTIGCVNYHMFLHFVMHFHVVLYTFIASIGTWLWWLWGGVIKVLYLKCQPLPIVKRSPPPPIALFFFFFLILPESSFFNRADWGPVWGGTSLCSETLVSRCWKVYFAATAIFLPPWLHGQVLWASSPIVEILATLHQLGEQQVSCNIIALGC